MIRKSKIWIAALALSAFSFSSALGAERASPALDTARKALAAAVAAHDVGRVIDLARFPLAVEMTGFPRVLQAARFRSDGSVFSDLFGAPDAQIVHCIAADPASLQSDKSQFGFGSWVVDCNGNEYFFSLVRGRWLFSGYENINE